MIPRESIGHRIRRNCFKLHGLHSASSPLHVVVLLPFSATLSRALLSKRTQRTYRLIEQKHRVLIGCSIPASAVPSHCKAEHLMSEQHRQATHRLLYTITIYPSNTKHLVPFYYPTSTPPPPRNVPPNRPLHILLPHQPRRRARHPRHIHLCTARTTLPRLPLHNKLPLDTSYA